MVTLSEKEAELAKAKDALNAARLAISYNQGDRSLQRAGIADLEVHVSRLSRECRELRAASLGASNAGAITPSWD